jgi:hypothetical protein
VTAEPDDFIARIQRLLEESKPADPSDWINMEVLNLKKIIERLEASDPMPKNGPQPKSSN